MKNLKYKICMITTLMLIITIIFPKSAEASTKSKVTKLVDELELFVLYNIETGFMDEQYKERKHYTLKMNKKNMATAAAFSIWNDQTHREEKDDYIVYKLSGDKLKKRSRSLFGKSAVASDLSTDKNQSQAFFAIQESDQPYIYASVYETEIDMIRKSLLVKKRAVQLTL